MNNSKNITLNYPEIIDLIPHRHPFLLIDRVEEIIVNESAEISSTIKYSKLILLWQFLHLALSIKKENKGILSNHLIVFLQLGQKERLYMTLFSIGIRWIQTFEKLPQMAPKIKKKAKITN